MFSWRLPEVDDQAELYGREPGAHRRVLGDGDLRRTVAAVGRRLGRDDAVEVVDVGADVAHAAMDVEHRAPRSEVQAQVRVGVVVTDALEQRAGERQSGEALREAVRVAVEIVARLDRRRGPAPTRKPPPRHAEDRA